jgi:AbiV family abortive infection protein
MADTYPPLPGRDNLLALLRAAMSNAKDLLADAQLLADAGSFPRAFALATLSWEELSKGELCVLAVVLREMQPDYFWENFRDHEGKLSRVHVLAAFTQPDPVGHIVEHASKVTGLSRSTQDLKERCLYVDYRRGKILLPSQVGETAARKQIKVVRDALAFAENAFGDEPLEDALSQVGTLSGALKNAIVAEPDATAAALQEALSGGSQEEIQRLVLRHTTITEDADD